VYWRRITEPTYNWPKEDDMVTDQQVGHGVALADMGSNDVTTNIIPIKRADHISWHTSNGDFARWENRADRKCHPTKGHSPDAPTADLPEEALP
jgi:hypothetical protein